MMMKLINANYLFRSQGGYICYIEIQPKFTIIYFFFLLCLLFYNLIPAFVAIDS